jgi:DNA-binding CsgD family transcriptional regulator
MRRIVYISNERVLEILASQHDPLCDPHPDPERDAKLARASAMLDAVLAQNILTARQFQVLEFARMGHSQRKIASILNIGQPRVSKHLQAAKKKIKKFLKKNGDCDAKTGDHPPY